MESRISNAKLTSGSSTKHLRVTTPAAEEPLQQNLDWDSEFLIPDYDSDENKIGNKRRRLQESSDNESDDDADADRHLMDLLKLPQIYFCSRTHSQISQFTSEIKKTAFKDIRCISIGSRRSLCIHQDVSRLTSDAAMNERCIEMQKTSSSTKSSIAKAPTSSTSRKSSAPADERRCRFHNVKREGLLADLALNKVRDIEEVVSMGRTIEACPYYASRKAVAYSQVVLAPYNFLLQAEMRTSMGVRLKDSVVIFDEAHNLVDAVNQIHSADLSLEQLLLVSEVTALYLTRFQTRLNGKNLYYVNILSMVLRKLLSFLKAETETEKEKGNEKQVESFVVGVNDLLFQTGLDHINLFKLKRHVVETRLAAKMGNFYASHALRTRSESHSAEASPSINPVSAVRSFVELLVCLASAEVDGMLVVSRASSTSQSGLRYVSLNPGKHFQQLVEQARSVILLGGTLQPFSYLHDMLFPAVPPSRVRLFSCEHIVHRSHVCPLVLPCGPRRLARSFTFTFENRLNAQVLQDLLDSLVELCEVVPFGVVVFFPSYSYLEAVLTRWRADLTLELLEKKKTVFVEARARREDETVWQRYSAAANAAERGVLMHFSFHCP